MPFTYVQSRRSDPGEGWHKRGYRDYGEMWLNIKEGSYGAVRGMGVNENSTFTELLHLVYRESVNSLLYPLLDLCISFMSSRAHQAVGPWYHVLDVLPTWATGITKTVVQVLIPPSFVPKGIYAMGDGYPLPEGWAFVLHSRRRALEPSDEPISVLFDGGETLIIKVRRLELN